MRCILYSGYNMEGDIEISLWMLKNISRVSKTIKWNVFQHKKRNFVSPSNHVLFFFNYYIDTNEILNRFLLISRTCHNLKNGRSMKPVKCEWNTKSYCSAVKGFNKKNNGL